MRVRANSRRCTRLETAGETGFPAGRSRVLKRWLLGSRNHSHLSAERVSFCVHPWLRPSESLPLICIRNLALLWCLGFGAGNFSTHAAFVYETPTEFLTSGDFNGDGIPDALVLDKATGNALVGYSDGNGNLTWSAPLVTGVANATGCGVEHFLATNRDCVAVTAPALNLVNLVDLSQTNWPARRRC